MQYVSIFLYLSWKEPVLKFKEKEISKAFLLKKSNGKEFSELTAVIWKISCITKIFRGEKMNFSKYYIKLHIYERTTHSMDFERKCFKTINTGFENNCFCIFNKSIFFVAV